MRAALRAFSFLTAAAAFFFWSSAAAHADQALSTSHFQTVHPKIFGSLEIFSADVKPFHKWTDMMARYREQIRHTAHPCAAGEWSGCEPPEWRGLIDELNGLDFRAKLERVNAEINRHPYVRSIDNWGLPNYWETPFEFLRTGGQCQDYAIAKYLLLRASGVPEDQLRLVVVRDMNLQLDHAVVVAYAEGDALLLDNQIPQVVPVSLVRHYRPYYSINEEGWWRHLPVRTPQPPAVVTAELHKP
ncbi:MAG: transglutaminase-like cysteine peptidase [Alphaproteobacteria bacterium]